MYCKKCGNQLPDDAAFCMKCGAPQGSSDASKAETKWETAEIHCQKWKNFLPGWRSQLWVQVIGPSGVRELHRTDDIKSPEEWKSDREQAALEDIVRKLGSEGWESVGRGEHWYSHRFRRRET